MLVNKTSDIIYYYIFVIFAVILCSMLILLVFLNEVYTLLRFY